MSCEVVQLWHSEVLDRVRKGRGVCCKRGVPRAAAQAQGLLARTGNDGLTTMRASLGTCQGLGSPVTRQCLAWRAELSGALRRSSTAPAVGDDDVLAQYYTVLGGGRGAGLRGGGPSAWRLAAGGTARRCRAPGLWAFPVAPASHACSACGAHPCGCPPTVLLWLLLHPQAAMISPGPCEPHHRPRL